MEQYNRVRGAHPHLRRARPCLRLLHRRDRALVAALLDLRVRRVLGEEGAHPPLLRRRLVPHAPVRPPALPLRGEGVRTKLDIKL